MATNRTEAMPLLVFVILALYGCTQPPDGMSSLRGAPVELRSGHDPDPQRIVDDVNAILAGMNRARNNK